MLEHHRETVASFLPTCSANHFPVLPFSTNTTFSLFIFCDSIRFDLHTNYNTLTCNANVVMKSEIAAIKFRKSVFFHTFLTRFFMHSVKVFTRLVKNSGLSEIPLPPLCFLDSYCVLSDYIHGSFI